MIRNVMVLACVMMLSLMAPAMAQENEEPAGKVGGSKSLEKRIRQLEDAIQRDVESERWYDRIQISGLVEVEAGYQNVDVTGEESEKSGDVDLATVELSVDAKIIQHVDGHVLFKYEEDDVFVDEGFITLVGDETFTGYLIAGRQYLPFGYFDSFFLTDPNTLVLGETGDGALVVGYRFGDDLVDLSLGAFNGGVDKIDEDDQVDSFVASVSAQPMDFLMIGASYTSNLASSDTLSEFINGPVEDLVGGWSAYLTVSQGIFKVIGEYAGALDEFNAAEIYEGNTIDRKPAAWNLEAGAAVMENLEVALRYGGSDDGGADFLPETQYGGVVNWGCFENTNLAIEYVHDEFEDDAQEVDTVTAQLAVEF